MKISVIVAAYNAEKYLEETLDSLLHQSMKDYEVIVVNDGSADHTADILNDYENRYPIMKVIHQKNGGPSSARNAGQWHRGYMFTFLMRMTFLNWTH